MRGYEYPSHLTLSALLTLPANAPTQPADARAVEAAWSAALGNRPVVLARSVARARAALLAAAGVRAGEPVGLPANATHSLIEAVKRHGARPHLLGLTSDLQLDLTPALQRAPDLCWAQPVGGLGHPTPLPGTRVLVDYADTLPDPTSSAGAPVLPTLWGLHLSEDPDTSGALLAFASAEDGALEAAVRARLGTPDLPDLARAQEQCRRLCGTAGQQELAGAQSAVLAETFRGLQLAAGLPLLPLSTGGGLPYGVGVRIPDEIDGATFVVYVRGENTPMWWLPDMRPLHYTAARQATTTFKRTAERLQRWLLIPVGPDYSAEEIRHVVLGVVKAADYLGVRWRTDPGRAARYAASMVERFGADHDAYRPAFAVA